MHEPKREKKSLCLEPIAPEGAHFHSRDYALRDRNRLQREPGRPGVHKLIPDFDQLRAGSEHRPRCLL